jgi:hypothetical protein
MVLVSYTNVQKQLETWLAAFATTYSLEAVFFGQAAPEGVQKYARMVSLRIEDKERIADDQSDDTCEFQVVFEIGANSALQDPEDSGGSTRTLAGIMDNLRTSMMGMSAFPNATTKVEIYRCISCEFGQHDTFTQGQMGIVTFQGMAFTSTVTLDGSIGP